MLVTIDHLSLPDCAFSCTEWHDSGGSEYNCEWYSEDDNCETHGDAYEYDGYTAKEACCACGGGTTASDSGSGSDDSNSSAMEADAEADAAERSFLNATEDGDQVMNTIHDIIIESGGDTTGSEPTTEPTAVCEDYTTTSGTEWHDSGGSEYNCEWYSEDDNCETHEDDYEYDGYTAKDACCACGGGTTGSDAGSGSDDSTEVEELEEFTHEVQPLDKIQLEE